MRTPRTVDEAKPVLPAINREALLAAHETATLAVCGNDPMRLGSHARRLRMHDPCHRRTRPRQDSCPAFTESPSWKTPVVSGHAGTCMYIVVAPPERQRQTREPVSSAVSSRHPSPPGFVKLTWPATSAQTTPNILPDRNTISRSTIPATSGPLTSGSALTRHLQSRECRKRPPEVCAALRGIPRRVVPLQVVTEDGAERRPTLPDRREIRWRPRTFPNSLRGLQAVSPWLPSRNCG